MKIRIQDQSIRVRLSMDELDLLAEGQPVAMNTPLGTKVLVSEIVPTEEAEDIGMQDAVIFIHLSQRRFNALKNSTEEGFQLSLGESELLVQKDYKCIGRAEEKNAGLFPNPKDDAAC